MKMMGIFNRDTDTLLSKILFAGETWLIEDHFGETFLS